MKALLRTVSLLLALVFCLTACVWPFSDNGEEGEEAKTEYNIIFALATIPPVMAALDAIDSGHETYAIIERGKTYSGIDSLPYFHNAGFDKGSNLSTGFTETEFEAMVAQIVSLKNEAEEDEELFFHIYVQDGTALLGAAMAANAGLSTDEFHVYMCEDGTLAYDTLRDTFVAGKTVTEEKDEVYDDYLKARATVEAELATVLSKTDNAIDDEVFDYNIAKAYALASLDNFTYYMQNEALIRENLEGAAGTVKTKLLSAFCIEGYTEEVACHLQMKYQKISAGVEKLSDTKRTDYLTLMYGEYYADTYASLTRTERGGEAAPATKLVYIGSRHSGYPKLASNPIYGIGGLASGATLPLSYEALDTKYKTPLLFATEADYALFLAVVNNADNYAEEAPEEIKEAAKVACFNLYIDYIFNLKMIYALYGEDYDLIMKGHPREELGASDSWGNRYTVTLGEGEEAVTYVYDGLLDAALLAFHGADSVGKKIGTVPYGTAAENLAYLGADIVIGGLPSSTYSGYDLDVGVLFIVAATDESIDGNASQVKERYLAGNLLYTENGETKTAVFYNLGNIYKTVSEIYRTVFENETLAETYEALYASWLSAVYPDAEGIDAQGFPIKN